MKDIEIVVRREWDMCTAERILSRLPPEERQAIARVSDPLARTRSVQARVLARGLASRHGVQTLDLPYGRPSLVRGVGAVSMSHASGWVGAAFSPKWSGIGLDLEVRREVRHREAIRARFLDDGEDGDFFDRWTRWEARRKCRASAEFRGCINLCFPESFLAGAIAWG